MAEPESNEANEANYDEKNDQDEAQKNAKHKKEAKSKRKEDDEYPKPPCNPRLEELAKPTHKLLHANYKTFRHVLPKEKVEAIGHLLQEDMAISTEEAAKCLRGVKQQYNVHKMKLMEQQQAKKEIRDLSHKKQKKLMKRCVRETLKTAIYNAYFNPKQIIMSDRLRKLSNLIVKDLCKVSHMKVPDRKESGRKSKFVFSVGDYFAYAIESMYYEIQVRNMIKYEDIKEMEAEQENK